LAQTPVAGGATALVAVAVRDPAWVGREVAADDGEIVGDDVVPVRVGSGEAPGGRAATSATSRIAPRTATTAAAPTRVFIAMRGCRKAAIRQRRQIGVRSRARLVLCRYALTT
jgi:hypothetical protein